jgi:hypothetical protein
MLAPEKKRLAPELILVLSTLGLNPLRPEGKRYVRITEGHMKGNSWEE